MSEENVEQEELVQEEGQDIVHDNEMDKQPLLDKNGKIVAGVMVAIAVIFGGIWAYGKFISEPAELAAHEDWWAENQLHFNDDYEAAINGDTLGDYETLPDIVEKTTGTQAGLIAKYDLGIAYLNTGEYQLARETLEGVDFGDEMVSTVALGAIGDSYMQESDAQNAISYYEKAIDKSENSFTCPLYLKKCAFAHEALEQWSAALAHYQRIKKEFPNSEQAKGVDKYIVKAEAKAKA